MLELVADNGPSPTHAERRRRLLAAVHIAKKKLGLEDDDYRAILARVTGSTSVKDCGNAQLTKVMAEFERMGFKPYGLPAQRAPAQSAIARKARALWIGLHTLGAVNDGSERALESFAKRQLGVDRMQWADQSQASPLIEALKAMAEREGWEQTLPPRLSSAERGRTLSERLLMLLQNRLAALGEDVSEIDVALLSESKLHEAASELGIRLREASGEG